MAAKPRVIRNLFSEKVHSGIKTFIDEYVQFLPMKTDDTDFMRKYINDVDFFKDLHHKITEYASDMFEENLKPSYSFLSLYENGGQCRLHIDRPQCYRTIDYLITQEDSNPWPLYIGSPISDEKRKELDEVEQLSEYIAEHEEQILSSTKWSKLLMNPNDAALYSGTHSWHYRPTKSNGRSSLVFWHFVKEDFNGPLQ